MQISLSPEVEQLVRTELATGRYQSENDVLREAVRLLSARDRRVEELRSMVQIGRDQLDRGEYLELDEAEIDDFFQGLQKRGRRRYEELRQKP
jgi:antitoxin ParD1/3/4